MPTKVEKVEPTGRDKLAALMNEMNEDQTLALIELAELLDSKEHSAIVDKIAALRVRTIPGSPGDSIIGSFFDVLNTLRSHLAQVAPQPMIAMDPSPE